MPLPSHLSEQSLGYALHTNRELGLMLGGAKPLAVFSQIDGDFPGPVRRYLRMFDRHVRAGTLVRRDHREVLQSDGAHLHVVLFARPEEAWRIDAMIDLRRHLGAWTPEHERAEGRLLGYEDWQNDLWISRCFGD